MAALASRWCRAVTRPALTNAGPPAARSVRGLRPPAQTRPDWAQPPDVPLLTDDDDIDPDTDPHSDTTEQSPKMDTAPATPRIAKMMPPAVTVSDPAPAAADPAPQRPSGSLSGLLDALAGPLVREGLRVHRVKPDGGRGDMLFTAPADEHADTLRERIARHGPGEYELAPVVDGRYMPGARRMTVDAPAPMLPTHAASMMQAPPAAAAAPALDPRDLVGAMSAAIERSQAAMLQQMTQLQISSRDAQLDIMREAMKHRGGAGAGGGDSGLLNTLIAALAPVLVAKLSEDPIERAMRVNAFNRELREDAQPRDETAGMLRDTIAGVAAAVTAAMNANARAATPQPAIARVVPQQPQQFAPGSAAPHVEPPAAVAPADDQLAMMVGVLSRLGMKGADAGTVLAVLEEMLTADEFAQLTDLLKIPGAVGGLLTAAPQLLPVRDWLERVVADVVAMLAPDDDSGAGDSVELTPDDASGGGGAAVAVQ